MCMIFEAVCISMLIHYIYMLIHYISMLIHYISMLIHYYIYADPLYIYADPLYIYADPLYYSDADILAMLSTYQSNYEINLATSTIPMHVDYAMPLQMNKLLMITVTISLYAETIDEYDIMVDNSQQTCLSSKDIYHEITTIAHVTAYITYT